MTASYKKLWRILIDRDIKKGLCTVVSISQSSIAKLKNENVTIQKNNWVIVETLIERIISEQ